MKSPGSCHRNPKPANKLHQTAKGLMTDGESDYVKMWIETNQIPTYAKSLDKRPQKHQPDEHYKILLVISETNFTQCFAKTGYKIVKNQFDAKNVNYNKYTLKQARDLKQGLEKMKSIKKNQDLLAALNIKDIYLCIQWSPCQSEIMVD